MRNGYYTFAKNSSHGPLIGSGEIKKRLFEPAKNSSHGAFSRGANKIKDGFEMYFEGIFKMLFKIIDVNLKKR